ncbi:hypothetical protein D3C80_1909700 [compost metagenome]
MIFIKIVGPHEFELIPSRRAEVIPLISLVFAVRRLLLGLGIFFVPSFLLALLSILPAGRFVRLNPSIMLCS